MKMDERERERERERALLPFPSRWMTEGVMRREMSPEHEDGRERESDVFSRDRANRVYFVLERGWTTTRPCRPFLRHPQGRLRRLLPAPDHQHPRRTVS